MVTLPSIRNPLAILKERKAKLPYHKISSSQLKRATGTAEMLS